MLGPDRRPQTVGVSTDAPERSRRRAIWQGKRREQEVFGPRQRFTRGVSQALCLAQQLLDGLELVKDTDRHGTPLGRLASGMGVAFVGGLAGDTERLRHLRPGPALLDRLRHSGSLELLGKASEGHHGGECLGGFIGRWDLQDLVHAVNSS